MAPDGLAGLTALGERAFDASVAVDGRARFPEAGFDEYITKRLLRDELRRVLAAVRPGGVPAHREGR